MLFPSTIFNTHQPPPKTIPEPPLKPIPKPPQTPMPEPPPASVSPENVEILPSSKSVFMKANFEPPKVGQYDYQDFSEVEGWILRLTKVYGPALGDAFEPFCKSRSRYLEEKKFEWAQGMENIIKNDVGVRRLREDHPEYFDDSNKGRGLTFYQGKFLGWDEEVGYNPMLKAVVIYEI